LAVARLNVLVLNAGSSSLKASLFRLDDAGDEGDAPNGSVWEKEQDGADDVESLLSTIWTGPDRVIDDPAAIDMVAHRVVFGGAELREPTRITKEVLGKLARVSEYAPAHNAAALTVIEAAQKTLGQSVPQIAVFDTQFHQTLSSAAFTYPGPHTWLEQGIRRFGFHGLSHRYTSHRAARVLDGDSSFRVVTCHLGSGCSLAAVRNGRSVDTTMGFTPMDGIPMARRSGAVDPGILIHLLRHGGHTVDSLDRMLNHDSGLAGLSGTSGDMREVIAAAEAGDGRAQLALDVFVHHVRKGIASMAASMNGLDALVFAGGIGERSPRVRAAIAAGLAFLGVQLEDGLNAEGDGERIISSTESGIPVMIIPAEESWVMARDSFIEVSKDLQARGLSRP
jgi:acetate kinase